MNVIAQSPGDPVTMLTTLTVLTNGPTRKKLNAHCVRMYGTLSKCWQTQQMSKSKRNK
jgi:hypothetical protein